MKRIGGEALRMGRGRRAREAVGVPEGTLDENRPINLADLPEEPLERMAIVEGAAQARFKPALREAIRRQVPVGPERDKRFFDAAPRNYAIESHRGIILYSWLNRASDEVQVFPELRKYKIPIKGEEDPFEKRYSNFVFKRIEQSKRSIDTSTPPFELNKARYFRPALELSPEHRETIYAWAKQAQLHMSIEMYLNGEYPEHMDEFSLDPKDGWVQGFAAAKILFPDLGEKIDGLFAPYWSRLRQIAKGMEFRSDPEYIKALIVLGARNAWIDETGEFHIEFQRPRPVSQPKPLPERAVV